MPTGIYKRADNHRRKISEGLIGNKNNFGKKHSEETKKKISEAMKNKKNHFYGKKHTKESKRKMRQNHSDSHGKNHSMYGKYHSKETKRKMSESHKGKNNPNWDPNREQVYAPYTEKHFMEDIRKQILEEQDFACGYCRTKKGDFDLHHINFDKQNDERWNKIFLCKSCHAKTQFNKEFWQEKLENLNILYIRGSGLRIMI